MNISKIPTIFWASVALGLGCYFVWLLIRALLVRRRLRVLLSEFESKIPDHDLHRAMLLAVRNDMYRCIRVVPKFNRTIIDAQKKTIGELFFPGIDTDNGAIVQAYDRLKKDVEEFTHKYVDWWRLSGVLTLLLSGQDKTSDKHMKHPRIAKIACGCGLGSVFLLLSTSLVFSFLDDPKASGVPAVENPTAGVSIVTNPTYWLLAYADEASNEHGLDYEKAQEEYLRALEFFIRITERRASLSGNDEFCNLLRTLECAKRILTDPEIDAEASIAKVAEFAYSFEKCMRLAKVAASCGRGMTLRKDEIEEVNNVLNEFHEVADRLIKAAKDLQKNPVTNDDARSFFDLGQWSCLKSRTATLYLIAVFPESLESSHTAAFNLKQKEVVEAVKKIDKQMKDINEEYYKKLGEYAKSIEKRIYMLEKLEAGEFSTVCESLRRS